MELLSGGALAWQQYTALLRKNATLTWRNRRSAALQLFSSLVFIFLIFCIDLTVRSRFSSTTAYRNVPDPEPLVAPPIPPCEDKFFIKSPCYDFLWSDGGSNCIRDIVDAIRKNNPGRPIPPEKTTGMDPITRRHVWDITEEVKKGRAIVLTTHSMEEADILGDRIAIMAKGELRCIGTSMRLKSKFGTGYIANVNFSGNGHMQSPNINSNTEAPVNPNIEAVKWFFKERLDVTPKEESRTFLTFVIPHHKEPLLTRFFGELQDREGEFGISDIQLGLTTLEEVFLNIAKQAELESSTAEGTLVNLNLSSGATIQIPKVVGIPGTETEEHPRGLMVCWSYWDQDENGSLCISGHSDEMPVPVHAELRRPPSLSRGASMCR